MRGGPGLTTNDASLSDVFAFIDKLDSSDTESSLTDVTSNDGDSSSMASPELRLVAVSVHAASVKRSSKKTRKPRLPGQVPQSTEFQRKKRDQVLALRQQVLELLARLEQLQRTRRQPTTTAEAVHGPQRPKDAVSVWEHLAIVQCRERQRSETTNRELKVILARQRKLERSVSKLLGRKDALEGMDLLCQLQPMAGPMKLTPKLQFHADLSDAVLAELEATTASLYMRTPSLFPPLQGRPTVSFSTKDKYDDPLGTYIEITSTTPMACPLHIAAELLWEGTTKGSQDPEKVPQFMRPQGFNSLARSCKLDLLNTVRIDGVNFLRRYIESDRIVLVSAATWFLPAKGIHFQDNVWTVASRSPVNPRNASVIQSFCQFGAQSSAATAASKEAIAPAQEYVRGSVGVKLRHLQEKQQRFLLEHASPSVGVC